MTLCEDVITYLWPTTTTTSPSWHKTTGCGTGRLEQASARRRTALMPEGGVGEARPRHEKPAWRQAAGFEAKASNNKRARAADTA